MSSSAPQIAGEPVKYEDLPPEHKKKYDDLKAILEAELIGAFEKTHSHGIKFKGFQPEGALDGLDLSLPSDERTRALRQEVNYAVAHSLHRHAESLVNTLERVALNVVQEVTKHNSTAGGSPAYVVYKVGGDPGDYQFLYERPRRFHMDINKTAFRVPGSVGLFEYVVMTFGLKNAGATYQRAMNYIFHDLIGKLVEIYIDDVVVKSVSVDGHLGDLRRVLDRKFGLRMNPKKCAFGVTAGQFLGFLVHERGIEIGLKSQEAVRTMKPPTTKKELQCLIGKINFVRSQGQALADLIAERINTDVAALSVRAWTMFFDGSVCEDGCGIGMLLVSPRGATYSFSIRLSTPCTNNVAEYEAICKGMELLLDAGAEAVEIFGDSKLVISQLTEEYKCESGSLFPLWMQCRELMAQFSIEDATELRLWALEKIKENKAKVARAYNKKLKPKEFQVGDLVWEAVLPLETKDKMYGKWSPNWHGPYKVDQVLKGNAYMLEQLDGSSQ
ncbi:hypothetical protein QYE76_033515 [Lolium multiflorum]|uniref:Uncharacterized protein n=1 Tax=Lolium multiflorum TaxID=4521 RepID=A0AAD8VJC7_LOLMU|nr:hypothetical protein QYE76_033515 [Lolium multiflorum]